MEGLCIKLLHETGGRTVGFIETIPGEYAWRVVNAAGYTVIHCLWVVGQGKGKGYGTRLLQACLADARAEGRPGVAMVASDGVWLAGKQIFLKNGFEQVDVCACVVPPKAAPTFRLLVHSFGADAQPGLPHRLGGAAGVLRRWLHRHPHATVPVHRGRHHRRVADRCRAWHPGVVVELTSS